MYSTYCTIQRKYKPMASGSYINTHPSFGFSGKYNPGRVVFSLKPKTAGCVFTVFAVIGVLHVVVTWVWAGDYVIWGSIFASFFLSSGGLRSMYPLPVFPVGGSYIQAYHCW